MFFFFVAKEGLQQWLQEKKYVAEIVA